MMENLTAVPNTPRATDVIPGMAHFARTGPANKTCRECKFFAPAADGGPSYTAKSSGRMLKPARCARYRDIMQGLWGAKVPPTSAACKYFDQSGNPPAPFGK